MNADARKWMRKTVAVALALLVVHPAPADETHDLARLRESLSIVEDWANYTAHGNQYAGDFVVDELLEARQQRFYVKIIRESVASARAKAQAKLEFNLRSDGAQPTAYLDPSLVEQRLKHAKARRDLERAVAAYDAVTACLDSVDNRCLEILDIDRQRAEWRASGDPMPTDPSVPTTAEMRELLEDAVKRHRRTMQGYRESLQRLQSVTNDLAGAHVIFGDRMGELRDYHVMLVALGVQLEDRRRSCEEDCALASREFARVPGHASAAAAASAESRRTMVEARALAGSCRTAADADRIEALVRSAQDDATTADLELQLAESTNLLLRDRLVDLHQTQDVSIFRLRWSDAHQRAGEAGVVLIDQLLTIERAFGAILDPKRDVVAIVDSLQSLDFLRDELASWERALRDEPLIAREARRHYGELQREYEILRTILSKAVAWTDELTVKIGGPDVLALEQGELYAKDEKIERELRALMVMPDCEVQESDLSAHKNDQSDLSALLGEAAGLLRKASDCRTAATGASPGGGGAVPPAPGGSAPTPPPVPAPTTAAAAGSQDYGGLVIVGLVSPGRISLGQAHQLEGQDHGGRAYSGVDWVTSDERVATVDGGGRLVTHQPGEAMILAKYEGMRAWLDVIVVDPGGSSPAAAPGGAGSAGSGAAAFAGPAGDAADAGGGVDADPEGGFDFGDGGTGTVETGPSGVDLLGASVTVDGPAPDDPVEIEVPSFADLPDAASIFNPEVDRQPLQPVDAPAGPSEAEIMQLLQQIDCSWLDGGATAYNRDTGASGCTCPPGTQLATNRSACVDCFGPQARFMGAVEAEQFDVARQALDAAEGCSWVPQARNHLREVGCLRAEVTILEDLNRRGPGAAQQLIQIAQSQGCTISPMTSQLVQSAAQPPPTSGWSQPQPSGSNVGDLMEVLSGVTQTLIDMQTGNAGGMPGSVPPPSSGPQFAQPGGGTRGGGQPGGEGLSAEECKQRLCASECADAITLLGEATTDRCNQCLKSRAAEYERCIGGGSASSDSPSSAWDSSFSSGSGAWATPQWTEPTGEGGGRCFAGGTYTSPHRYSIACDGNDGSGIHKLVLHGKPNILFGPASFTDCQRYLAKLTGGR